jgi:hypothetical protein
MITEQQVNLLNAYRDRSFVNSILAEQSYNYYNWLKNIINVPLIISNTAMVAINGSIENQELLKIEEFKHKEFHPLESTLVKNININIRSNDGNLINFVDGSKVFLNLLFARK